MWTLISPAPIGTSIAQINSIQYYFFPSNVILSLLQLQDSKQSDLDTLNYTGNQSRTSKNHWFFGLTSHRKI